MPVKIEKRKSFLPLLYRERKFLPPKSKTVVSKLECKEYVLPDGTEYIVLEVDARDYLNGSVAYKVRWGDGETSQWVHGTSVSLSHTFVRPKYLDTKIIIKDACGDCQVLRCEGASFIECPEDITYCIGQDISIPANVGLEEFLYVQWGDGTNIAYPSGLENVSHSYGAIGEYNLLIQIRNSEVVDGENELVLEKNCTINVAQCQFTVVHPTDLDFVVGDTFTATSDINAQHYLEVLDWGDGSPPTQGAAGVQNISHQFVASGSHTIIVNVVNALTNEIIQQSECLVNVEEEDLLCDPNLKCVIVDTDLGDTNNATFDPDDVQSFVHMLCCTDVLDLKGVVSTTVRRGVPYVAPQDNQIRRWIKWMDLDGMISAGHNVMTEAEALANVAAGHTGGGAPPNTSPSAGSNTIVRLVQEHCEKCPVDTPRIWILVWGAITTTAKALEQLLAINPALLDHVGIYQIGNWNIWLDEDSQNWIEANLSQMPNLLWIRSNESFRGMHQGGNQTGYYNNLEFIPQCVRGKGTTGTTPESQIIGDAYPVAQESGVQNIYKGGDDPSWLYLYSCALGLSDSENPQDMGSWGGWFTPVANLDSTNVYEDMPYDSSLPNVPSLHSRVYQHKELIFDTFHRCWEKIDSVT